MANLFDVVGMSSPRTANDYPGIHIVVVEQDGSETLYQARPSDSQEQHINVLNEIFNRQIMSSTYNRTPQRPYVKEFCVRKFDADSDRYFKFGRSVGQTTDFDWRTCRIR